MVAVIMSGGGSGVVIDLTPPHFELINAHLPPASSHKYDQQKAGLRKQTSRSTAETQTTRGTAILGRWAMGIWKQRKFPEQERTPGSLGPCKGRGRGFGWIPL